MNSWRDDVESALAAFVTVAGLAGDPILIDEIVVEFMEAPHRPPTRLPKGTMAIYGFWCDGEWLKIGKAGPRSAARYTSQHYGLHAPSTLAKSLIRVHSVEPIQGFDPAMPGDWIKAMTNRLNILLPSNRSIDLLALLEAYLHLRLKPKYEGFAAQRAQPVEEIV